MNESHVWTLAIGGSSNSRCNIRQVQDSLVRNGKMVILLALFMNLYEKVMLYRGNFEVQ